MACVVIKTSAPGSLMLMGEHAVLHDKPALSLAIQQRLHVSLKSRTDDKIFISSALGSYETCLKNLKIEKPWQFILATCLYYQLTQGFEITVNSEFSSTLGFGSSAALTVALAAAFRQFIFKCSNKDKLLIDARLIIQNVQTIGSGADAAASIYGGIVYYHQNQNVLANFKQSLPLQAIYCGYKTSTVEVIAKVNALRQKQTEFCDNLFRQMGSLCHKASLAIAENNLALLAELMRAHQVCQQALQVSDETLDNIIASSENCPDILAAKISGSGLGDCIIALGQMPLLFPNAKLPNSQQFSIQTDLQGVCYDDSNSICTAPAS